MQLMEIVEVTAEAVEALVAIEQASLPSCPDAVVAGAVEPLARALNQLEAARTAVVAEWAHRQLFALDGSRSASARLARDIGCSSASARLVVRRAVRLRSMPATAEVFRNGDLSVDKIDLLCAANADGREDLFARDEHLLVSEAKRLHAEDLHRVVRYWIAAADDAKAEQRARHDFESRNLSVSKTSSGKVVARAQFDPVSGAVWHNELERLAAQLFDEDWATAKEIWGDDVRLDRLARTPGQRRIDAQALMAERSAAAGPGHTPARPLVTIHLGEDAARKALCELDDGTVTTPGQIRPWLPDADFERVVFGAKSRVIDLSVRTRLFRGGLRRAIELRDRHCTHPGCRVPAHRCDIDHIIEWSAGGETTQANGRLLCPAHNQQRPGRTTPDRGPDDEGNRHGPRPGTEDEPEVDPGSRNTPAAADGGPPATAAEPEDGPDPPG